MYYYTVCILYTPNTTVVLYMYRGGIINKTIEVHVHMITYLTYFLLYMCSTVLSIQILKLLKLSEVGGRGGGSSE